MSVFAGVSSCVSLSVRIVDLLLISKSNKHEFRSLLSAVDNIKVFLTALPPEGITQQGEKVLSEYGSSSGYHPSYQVVQSLAVPLELHA
jgi:hypothetical protein